MKVWYSEFSVVNKLENKFYVRYEATLKEKVKEEQMEDEMAHSPESIVYVEKEKLNKSKCN